MCAHYEFKKESQSGPHELIITMNVSYDGANNAKVITTHQFINTTQSATLIYNPKDISAGATLTSNQVPQPWLFPEYTASITPGGVYVATQSTFPIFAHWKALGALEFMIETADSFESVALQLKANRLEDVRIEQLLEMLKGARQNYRWSLASPFADARTH